MSDIRYGIIGCGNIARAHMAALKNGKGIVCAGLTDRVAGRAEKLNEESGGGFRVFDSGLEMVQSPDIDAVILAVPNYQHEPMFRLAAEHGKHILCEKPMAMTVQQAQGMADIAREKGVKVQLGLCTRFEPDIEALMDHIRAGNIGSPYFARTDLLRQRGAPSGWFGNREKSGGGPLIDIGVHYIDACWYLLGKPRPVRCKALNYKAIDNRYPKDVDIYSAFEEDDVYSVEDSSHGMITFENGAGIMYQASWSLNAADTDRLEVYGTKGGFIKEPPKLFREEASGMTQTELHYKWADCYTRQLEAFARVIRDEEACRTPAEDGVQVQKMLCGLYASAESGREIEL